MKTAAQGRVSSNSCDVRCPSAILSLVTVLRAYRPRLTWWIRPLCDLWLISLTFLGPPKHWDDVVPYWIGGYKSKGCCWTTGQKEDEKMKVIMARERRFHEINHFFSSCHLVAVRRLCVWLLVGRRLPSYFAPPISLLPSPRNYYVVCTTPNAS